MSGEPPVRAYSPAKLSREQVDALLQSGLDSVIGNAYVEVSSTLPKNESNQAQLRDTLRDKYELNLSAAVQRVWELPPVILQRADADYVRLLVEARELFTMGYFYSCVAMCGIVGEKIIKDLLRESLLIFKEDLSRRPSSEAFDQLERVDVSSIARFMNKAELIDSNTYKAADELVQLRNRYAHARGKNPEVDALEAIKHLHSLLEGTVSLLKDFEILDGKLVPRHKRQ